MSNRLNSKFRVSEWLLFNAKWEIFQPFHGETQVTFNWPLVYIVLFIFQLTFSYSNSNVIDIQGYSLEKDPTRFVWFENVHFPSMKYPCILKLHTNDTNNNTYTVKTSICNCPTRTHTKPCKQNSVGNINTSFILKFLSCSYYFRICTLPW
jgi:hypothetical protein